MESYDCVCGKKFDQHYRRRNHMATCTQALQTPQEETLVQSCNICHMVQNQNCVDGICLQIWNVSDEQKQSLERF